MKLKSKALAICCAERNHGHGFGQVQLPPSNLSPLPRRNGELFMSSAAGWERSSKICPEIKGLRKSTAASTRIAACPARKVQFAIVMPDGGLFCFKGAESSETKNTEIRGVIAATNRPCISL